MDMTNIVLGTIDVLILVVFHFSIFAYGRVKTRQEGFTMRLHGRGSILLEIVELLTS